MRGAVILSVGEGREWEMLAGQLRGQCELGPHQHLSGAAPPLRLRQLLRPQENCCSPSSGQAAGRSHGPRQNSNFPFISAASPAILKG